MERNDIRHSEQKKEVVRQLNIMAASGCMGLKLENPITGIVNEDKVDIEQLSK